MAVIDYVVAREVLDNLFALAGEEPELPVLEALVPRFSDFDALFESKTQSYREVLLGCAIVHLLNPAVNIRLPYAKQGDAAFNGRTLDEQVINPFFQDNLIPCSKGPYLATFRRNVTLTETTAEGLRDKKGYFSMLSLLVALENCSSEEETRQFVLCMLQRFIVLRNASRIPLARINRMSVEQYDKLLTSMLQQQSGGLLPVYVTVAYYQMFVEFYRLAWEVTWQGINVADQATGAEGDVTIKDENGSALLAIEITERPLDQRRIVSTFNTKIINSDIREYLFVYTSTEPDKSAKQAARKLFSQGYDVNFASVTGLVINAFLSMPSFAREVFTNKMLVLLDSSDTPSAVKIIWNECVKSVVEI